MVTTKHSEVRKHELSPSPGTAHSFNRRMISLPRRTSGIAATHASGATQSPSVSTSMQLTPGASQELRAQGEWGTEFSGGLDNTQRGQKAAKRRF